MVQQTPRYLHDAARSHTAGYDLANLIYSLCTSSAGFSSSFRLLFYLDFEFILELSVSPPNDT